MIRPHHALLLALACAFVLTPASHICAQAPSAAPLPAASVSPETAKATDAAQAAATAWLKLIDNASYPESWQTAAAFFQKAITQDNWTAGIQGARGALGDLVGRKVKSATFTKTLPGAPDGQYVVIQYETEFAKKKAAIETVTPMLETDGTWKVSGYYIR